MAIELTKADRFPHRVLAPAFLLACLLLGGSSSGGAVANGLLQLIGLGVILVVLAGRGGLVVTSAAWSVLAITGAAVAYLLVTLVPLPPSLWTMFPHREGVAHGFALLGVPAPMLGISLDRDGTIRALLSLVPPVAMFLSILAAPAAARRHAVMLLGIAAAVSVLLGVAQVATGFRSNLYLYAITSRGGAVGFFANRNHLATLCLMTLPWMAALAASARQGSSKATRVGQHVVALGMLTFLTLGAGVVQSLAGWLLLLPTLLGSWLIYQHRRNARLINRVAPILGLVLISAILLALFAPLSPTDLNRTLGETRPDQRHVMMATTAQAAWNYFPVGSGAGTFQRLYPQYEDPRQSTLAYVNHAHNDYLELVLEMGVVGLVLLAALLGWWAVQARRLWSAAAPNQPLGRAATVSLLILFAHSFVDYPVRTSAIAAVAALACGLMAAREDGQPYGASRRRGRTRGGLGGDMDRSRTIQLGVSRR